MCTGEENAHVSLFEDDRELDIEVTSVSVHAKCCFCRWEKQYTSSVLTNGEIRERLKETHTHNNPDCGHDELEFS